MFRLLKKIFFACVVFGIIFVCLIVTFNRYIQKTTGPYIFPSVTAITGISAVQTVMILGARVTPDGYLSDMLVDRAHTAREIVQAGYAPTILISADNSRAEYDEPRAVRNWLARQGIPSDIVFLDFAGFDTYDSMYRSKHIFDVKKMIISTQKFHLPRAVWLARQMGIDAYGVVADRKSYVTIRYSQYRELFANIKSLVRILCGSLPTYTGEVIPITGVSNGNR